MNGFNRSIRKKLHSVEPHLVVVGKTDDLQTAEQRLKSEPDITFNYFFRQDVILRTLDGRFAGGVAKGLAQNAVYNFLNEAHKLQFKSQFVEALDSEAAALSANEVAVGAELARDLNLFEGDEVLLIPPEVLINPRGEVTRFERMKVKTTFSTDISEVDSKLVLFEIKKTPLKFQSKASGEDGIEVFMRDPRLATDLQKKLGAELTSESDARIETWADRNRALFFALRLEKAAMTTFLSLSILITCFSLITVLTMLISNKRKEIGLLMSIGFSRQRVSNLFLQLGLLLSGIGLFGGLGLGLLTSWLIEKYPLEILPDIYFDSSIPSEINYGFISIVTLFCFVIAFLAAYVPVQLYLQKSPAENLRLRD